ncbi:unnamed protein product [Symbiodinium pilosum]|uniref:PROP1-like PPR domain-containing protein n=1 Tax=Symbiodinium pilosum TaxID=2952 RepID=A0A812SSH3_SYMPI|nr:unnamed protein product [Symbiodinium pilosum]
MTTSSIELAGVEEEVSCVNEAVWFAAGFLLFRLALRYNLLPSKIELWTPQTIKNKGTKGGKSPNSASKRCVATQEICNCSEAGDKKAVLAKWKHLKKDQATAVQLPGLEAVAEALALHEPSLLADELTHYLTLHPLLARPSNVHGLVAVILKTGQPELAQAFVEQLEAEKMHLAVATKVHDQILGCLAAKGLYAKVSKLLARKEPDSETWISGSNAAIRGFLQGGHLKLAIKFAQELQEQGCAISPAAAAAILDTSCSKKEFSIAKVLDMLAGVRLPMECAAAVMSTCLKMDDPATARKLEARLRAQGQVPFAVLEPLLKLAAKHDEEWAQSLLQESTQQNMYLSEGLCGLVLSRCGEARHIQLAEAIQQYLRERKMTSLATYKTLMKVYATCDLLDRACDLYDDILADGISPDSVMYGCLAKFAAKCGRDGLSDRLFSAASDKPQGGDVQNYMWLIRSAGQRHDVQRAINLLRQLQNQKAVVADAAIYNCVLDVCMSNGATVQADEIFQEMLQKKLVTLITYNTLMKGHAAKGDLIRARQLMQDMQEAGLKPNSASFNCLLSTAVTGGNYNEAWSIFESMRKCGVEADSFTLCILMKIVRKANRRDAQRALSVLDASQVDICKDEVLLNTVLDACIHLKDTRRLSWILRDFEAATLLPTVQNYGLIIKAYACLKQTRKCWASWHEMTDKSQRGLVPSDVALSCMLDSIVSAGQVEDAVTLFEQWRSVVPPNTIIYSNIIKGFAAQGDADRALDMYRQLRAEGLKMNLVAYSTLIDAQARAGKIDKAHALLREMREDGVEPNTITYSSLVKGHCKEGDLDGALTVFEQMVASGVLPDTVMYNTLLDGSVRACRFSLCDQLLKEMEQSGAEPSNFTLSIVVKMWGKRKKLDKAFEAVRSHAKAQALQLDSKLCTCLISACFHNGAPKRALEALEEMKSWPNCDGPDAGTYEQLIEQLVKARLVPEAAVVAKEAVALACGPRWSIKPLNTTVLRVLQRGLEQSGNAKLWSSLKDQLQRARLPTP